MNKEAVAAVPLAADSKSAAEGAGNPLEAGSVGGVPASAGLVGVTGNELIRRRNGWQAFRLGLSRSLRYPQLLIIAYLASLLSAGLLALIPALALTGPAHRTAVSEAANGIDAWLMGEIMMSPLTHSALEGLAEPRAPDWLQQWFLIGAGVCLVLPLVAWLSGSFLSGGALLTFVEAPQPFGWRRFLWGCWHWWGAFLLLNAAQGLAAQVVFGGLLYGAIWAGVAVGGWLSWLTLPLIVLLAAGWLALFESTRVLAVAGGTRNVFRAFGRALALTFRRPLSLFLLYLLSLLFLLLMHLVFRLGLMPVIPLAWWPVVLMATQAFIVLRLWARLARWGGVVGMASDG